KVVAKYQPAKLAAFEGVFETKPSTPISVGGWVDLENKKVHSLKIPGGLSFLTYGNLKKPVTGLDKIPREDWPNVPVVFQTYHLMILCWAIMCIIALMGIIYFFRKKLEKPR